MSHIAGMPKARNFTELQAKMPAEARAKSEEIARNMLREMPLVQLRAARQMKNRSHQAHLAQSERQELVGLTDTEEVLPSVIESDEQYDAVHARFSALIRKRPARTADETKLMRLLGLLIQEYDRRHGLPPDESTPAERLQFLMDHSGTKPSDLLPIFGQRSHVNEALNGKRPISAVQARKLGEMFHMNPGLFI